MGITVNADDFGISAEVNEAIALAFERGLINRTTLMTNMPFAKEAMELAASKGFADKVGVHLNLTAGKPLTADMANNSVMCSKEGLFTADFARNMKTRFFLDQDTRRCVYKELSAQLDMYEKLGGTLWHVDSHHHVHTDPSVWMVLKKVINKYPVTSIRLGRNMYRGGNPAMHVYKIILNASIKKQCSAKLKLFGSAEDYRNWVAAMNAEQLELFKKKEIEVMVHPMFDGDGNLTDEMETFAALI